MASSVESMRGSLGAIISTSGRISTLASSTSLPPYWLNAWRASDQPCVMTHS